jgi:ADP-ribosylglycohydrolase
MFGTAVGDSLGLAAEGMGPETIRRLGRGQWRHRFFFGKGMVSDDTEHTFFVAQALLAHGDNALEFKRSLAWKFRWWLLGVPAGIGFGTLRAILKLWFFLPLEKSGVYSAGNGPAMRSAVIGAYFSDDRERIDEFVRCSTELTHRDPRALVGALAVAYAAAEAFACAGGRPLDSGALLERLSAIDRNDEEWIRIVGLMEECLVDFQSVDEFAAKMDLQAGVTGYVYDTVPVAIYGWLFHYGNFEAALTEVLSLGGDTDTVGAITGALAGIMAGELGISKQWIRGIAEWPRSVSVLRRVADALADGHSGPVRYFWPGVILRNAVMIIIVIGHVLLRLLPVGIRRRIGM